MAEEEDIKVEPLEPEVLAVRENKSASSLLKKNDGNVVMEALKDGTWYPARIIDPPNAGETAKVDAEKHVFVHFCGLSNADDQWLHIDRYLSKILRLNTKKFSHETEPFLKILMNGTEQKILRNFETMVQWSDALL